MTISTFLRQSAQVCALALMIGALATPSALAGGDLAHMSPEKVLAQSDVIFQGTVVSKAFGWTDARRIFATTEYTIALDRTLLDREGWLAANSIDGRVTLSIMGGEQDGVKYRASGMPTLVVGESAFIMLSGEHLRNKAMSPIVGDSEGLFRVAPLNGEWKVFTPGGCGGPPRPVDFRFFAKFRDPNATYSPDEFAAEVLRALPLADASPELRSTQPAPLPSHLVGQAHGPNHTPQIVTPDGAATAVGPSEIPGVTGGMAKPQPPAARNYVEAVTEPLAGQGRLEYGFPNDTDPPEYPIVFNVPPGTWWRQAFIDEQARWNRYASGLFRFFTESNNQIGWPNGRFETGFLNNQQMIDLYGRGWGTNTLARCITREGVFTDRIVEADIAYNPTQTFSDNQGVIYSNASINSFRTTALHELGHAFGRVHAWESNPGGVYPSCLNYSTNGFYDAEHGRVFADDAESIRAAYGGNAMTDFGITLWRNSGSLVPFSPGLSVNGVTGLSMPASVLQGNSFPVYNIWLENIGTVTRGTTIDWWLDPTPFDFNYDGAVYCSSTTIGTLARYNGVAVSSFVTTPQGIPPGTYSLMAVIADNDAVFDNDFAWSQGTIRVDFNPAFSPPSNDSRNSPRSIGIGTTSGSTQFATSDGTATCGSSNGSPDVWFTFVAPYAGYFEADTCGSGFDTVLSVSQRQFPVIIGGGFTYVELNCNDDAVGGDCSGSTQSRIFVNNVAAGAVLRIRLGGFNGARGNYVLRTRMYPANDFCADAAVVTAGTYTATLAGSTNDRTGSCGQTQSTPDVWFRYTWPEGCNTVNLNTTGSNFDTVLEVLPVCSAFNITPLGCNDDCQFGTLDSCLTITRGAETTLRIRVTNYGGNPRTGDFVVLNISNPAPTNDTCGAAAPITDGDFAFDNSCGNTDPLPLSAACGSSSCIGDFWFSYTAPISGQLQISASAAFPTAIALYPGFACPGDPEQAIACNVDLASAAVSASVAAGETFLIRMGGSVQAGFPTPIGAGTFSIHTIELPPANDSCESAEAVLAGQALAGNLTLATPDGASNSDRVAGGPDVWYAFTAPADGILRVSTCTTFVSSGLDTVVSIHSACPGDTFSELASSDVIGAAGCTDDPMLVDPQDAQIETPVVSGQLYFIRIGATDPALLGGGTFSASILFLTPADACTGFISVAEGDNSFSTVGATPDGPAHDCFDGTEPDIWFSYTPVCTGTVRIDTCSQPYDTKLAVYLVSCPTVDDLPIACNNDDGPACPGSIGASLEFAGSVGINYYIRIGGDVPTASTVSINCSPAPHAADSCGNANAVYDGDAPVTSLASSPDGPAGGCFDGSENDVWYEYLATCTGTVTMSLCTDAGDSKLAVYAETTCPVGEPIACNDNDGPVCAGTAASLQFAAVAGVSYQLRIAIADDAAHTLSISCTPGSACPADYNNDGNVDPDDLGDFINCYFAVPPCETADFNQDGDVNPDDLGDFINIYFGPPC